MCTNINIEPGLPGCIDMYIRTHVYRYVICLYTYLTPYTADPAIRTHRASRTHLTHPSPPFHPHCQSNLLTNQYATRHNVLSRNTLYSRRVYIYLYISEMVYDNYFDRYIQGRSFQEDFAYCRAISTQYHQERSKFNAPQRQNQNTEQWGKPPLIYIYKLYM